MFFAFKQARQSGLKAAILFKVALTNDSIFENLARIVDFYTGFAYS